MTENTCLNCGFEISGKYCSACGQKTDTHRISFKRFISHDIMHGTLHLERGMLYTAKQALLRPGQAAMDYISGKRVRYYNIFYFILLLIGLILYMTHYYNELALQYNPDRIIGPQMNEAGRKINQILSKYNKLFIFSFAPIMAFNSYLLFRRKKLNYSEHFIVSGMLLLGTLILIVIFMLFRYLEFAGLPASLIDAGQSIIQLVIIAYLFYGYFNAFRRDYTFMGFSVRMLVFLFFCCIEFAIFLILIVGIASNWNSDTEIEFLF